MIHGQLATQDSYSCGVGCHHPTQSSSRRRNPGCPTPHPEEKHEITKQTHFLIVRQTPQPQTNQCLSGACSLFVDLKKALVMYDF